MKKKILVFASGTAHGGGSGAANLIERSHLGDLGIEVVGLVSNHARGGVYAVAEKYGVPFCYFASGAWSADDYRRVLGKFDHDLVALSGWLKPVRGNDMARTINIHPGRLPRFGGKYLYGDNIHRAVLDAYRKGEIKYSGVSMHFVPDYDDSEYDTGPVFFEYWVPILGGDTIETLKRRVNIAEHHWQPYITSQVAHGFIRWEPFVGKIMVPRGYPFTPRH